MAFHIERVIDDIGGCFSDIKEVIADVFLLALHGESLQDCTNWRHNLAALPVKSAGLAIPGPSATSVSNYKAITLVYSHLLAAFKGTESLSSTDHKSVRTMVMAELKLCRTEKLDSTLTTILEGLDCNTCRTIL
jgi:hypothetical protein